MQTSSDYGKVLLTLILLSLMGSILIACRFSDAAGFLAATATPTSTITTTPTLSFTATATLTSTPLPPTLTPKPTFTPAPYYRPPLEKLDKPLDGTACIGNTERLSCLDPTGWSYFSAEQSSDPNGKFLSLSACTDDSIFALTSNSIQKISPEDNTVINLPELAGPNKLYCDSLNRLWVAYYGGAAAYANGSWQTYESTNFSIDASGNEVITDISGDPNGNIWISTLHSLASYADGTWAVFQNGSGFTGDYLFSAVEVNPDGAPCAGYASGLLFFDDVYWRDLPRSQLGPVNDLVIKPGNQAWIATNNGILIHENGVWSLFDRSTNSIPSNMVNRLAIDETNRLWAATAWGLAVYSDGGWTTLQMSSSDISADNLLYLAVTGNGPPLPVPAEKPDGSLAMNLMTRYAELSNAAVQLCVEPLGFGYNGATPCESQPYHLSSKTDYEGRLILSGIPAGQYLLAVELKPGQWTTVRDSFGVLQYFEVKSGEISAYSKVIVPLLQ